MDDTITHEQDNLTDTGERAMIAVDEPGGSSADAARDNGQPAVIEASAPINGADVAMDEASLMEQFLSDPSHDYKTLKYGDVMDGIIAYIDREELLVDIGSKSEGIVPAREYSSLTSEEKKALSVGSSVLVFVVQPENPEGHAVVSIDRARQEKSWRHLQEIFEANDVIEAEVTNYNKGGLLVNLDGVRGFVPASQVSEIRGGDESSKQADMARLIGSSLPLKVIEINRHRNRLILSERQAIQERRDVMKERLIEELKEGEIRKGRVSSICDFGAFVDIGGADGLVHLSELSWSRVRHPAEVLKIGQEVDVYVLGINPQEKKIALSIKRTQAEPWSRVAAKYEVGQLVRGAVTQLANFGAFARIEDGIEGLIHVSELADERITHPKQVVREGQELLLRIIRIDPQRRRMGLSLRRALDTPDEELVAVFGPEILEERDRIVQTIRAALEAEGIEVGSGRAAREEAASGAPASDQQQSAASAQVGDGTDASAASDTSAETSASSGPATAAAEPDWNATAPRPKPRHAPAPKPEVEIPTEIGGEPLSAIAMAFAKAGGSDMVVEATAEGDEEPSADATVGVATEEPGQAPVATAPDPDAASAEAAAPEKAAVGDDDPQSAESGAEDGGGLVGTITEAVTSTVSSAAGALASRVAGLADAIRSGDDMAETADDEPPATAQETEREEGGGRTGGDGPTH